MTPVPPSGRSVGMAGGRPDSSARPNTPRSARLEVLLSDLGPDLQRGIREAEALPRFATGLPEVDDLLRGGIPRGRLCEISGSASSGRTTLVLSLLARTTRTGECVAWVDPADAFDPSSAQAVGVDLDRILWVRPPDWTETLRASERLLDTEGFPLVVLDLANSIPRHHPPHASTWLRLARLATSTHTALLLLSQDRLAGSRAEIAIEMQPARARFAKAPALLEELETHAVLVRNRQAPGQRRVRVRLLPSSAA